MKRVLSLLSWVFLSCSDGGQVSCGPGTTEVDGACVPAIPLASVSAAPSGDPTEADRDAGPLLGDSAMESIEDECNTVKRQGARMVKRTFDGVEYCIDATETSNAEYSEFLASGPDAADQPTLCIENTVFEPGPPSATSSAQEDAEALVKHTDPKRPVRTVDWCDATAYCEWAGKRLCKADAHLETLGPVPPPGEWDNACTDAGRRIEACAVSMCGRDEPVADAKCLDDTGELFGFCGGPGEWLDGCIQDVFGGPDVMCMIAGVSDFGLPVRSNVESGSCASFAFQYPTNRVPMATIRCCADTVPR